MSEPAPEQPTRQYSNGRALRTALAALSGIVAGWASVIIVRRRRSQVNKQRPPAALPVIDPVAATSSEPVQVHGSLAERAASLAAPDTSVTRAGVASGVDARWSPAAKIIAVLCLFALGLMALYWSRSIIPILVTAALIALVLGPLIGWFRERLHFPPGLATATAYLLAVLAILSIPIIIIPTIWDGVNEIRSVGPEPFYGASIGALQHLQGALQTIPVIGDVLSSALQPLDEFLQTLRVGISADWFATAALFEGLSVSRFTFGAVTGIVGPLLTWIVAAAFTILISVYLTSSRYSVRRFVMTHVPPAHAPELATLFDRIEWTWSAFLQGQLKLMFLIGIVVMLGNFLLGNRYALLLGIISGVLELIPTIGPALALIPAVVVALIFGSSWIGVNHLVFAIIVLVFYLLVQLVENQVVVPRVLGDAVELPPLVVLVGVLVAGSQAGILGALIAVPVIGTAREIVAYTYGKIIEAPAIEGPPVRSSGITGRIRDGARNLVALLSGRNPAAK